jgi:hypothetical protein
MNATEYARTKSEGDRLCWELHQRRGLPLVGIYPGAVIGAGHIKPSGQYIQNLLGRKLPVTIFPRSVFTVVYVRDVAEAIIRAIEKEDTIGQRYLVGKEQLTLADINRMVHEVSTVSIPRIGLPAPMVMATAAILTGIAAVIKKPPLWGLSLDMARMLRLDFNSTAARRSAIWVFDTPQFASLSRKLSHRINPPKYIVPMCILAAGATTILTPSGICVPTTFAKVAENTSHDTYPHRLCKRMTTCVH